MNNSTLVVENPFRERRKLPAIYRADEGHLLFLRALPHREILTCTHAREENCALELCKNLFTDQGLGGKEVEATTGI